MDGYISFVDCVHILTAKYFVLRNLPPVRNALITTINLKKKERKKGFGGPTFILRVSNVKLFKHVFF